MGGASSMTIRAFASNDIKPAMELWSGIAGLGLTDSDNEESVAAFLQRNPGFSAVASTSDAQVVGAVLCGHNGRAGFLYHLAVAPSHRRCGIGTLLVEFCFDRLAEAHIPRSNVFVYTANESGNEFWLRRGWNDPSTWKVLQKHVEI
jgi:ribosomal protein S18 acetylase RimI-like enzyme